MNRLEEDTRYHIELTYSIYLFFFHDFSLAASIFRLFVLGRWTAQRENWSISPRMENYMWAKCSPGRWMSHRHRCHRHQKCHWQYEAYSNNVEIKPIIQRDTKDDGDLILKWKWWQSTDGVLFRIRRSVQSTANRWKLSEIARLCINIKSIVKILKRAVHYIN